MKLSILEEVKQDMGFDPDAPPPACDPELPEHLYPRHVDSFIDFLTPKEVQDGGETVDSQGSGGTVRGAAADSAAVATQGEVDGDQDADRLPPLQGV